MSAAKCEELRAKGNYSLLLALRTLLDTGGQGRNRTADAGLFRAAYRISEVVWHQRDIIHYKELMT